MKLIREWLPFQLSPSIQQQDGAARIELVHCSSSQAYINRLSFELLADIFVRCLPFTEWDSFVIPKSSHAPLLLCQICGYWRQVALATPKLWASISIDSTIIHRSLVALWLARSQPSPISFHISSSSSPFSKKSARAVFAMLLSNLDRWHDVHLKLDKTLGNMVLMIPPERLSTARHLGLDARGCTKEQCARLLSVTRSFPNLQRLAFFAPFAPLSNSVPISTTNLPCSQLTHIRLTGGFSMYQCSEILSNCNLIVNCQLCGIYGTSESITQRNTRLPYLRSLKLDSVANTCDLGDLLDVLICPAIRILSINQGRWRLPTPDVQVLNKFLNHSERGLHELRLSDSNVTEIDLLACLQLRSLRSLRTLCIAIPSITDLTLSFLQRRKHRNYDTFPNLRKLSLKYCYTSDGALVNMVTSRRPSRSKDPAGNAPGSMLHSIHVAFRLPLTIDHLTSHTKKEMDSSVQRAHKLDIARLKFLQEEGLLASWSTRVSR